MSNPYLALIEHLNKINVLYHLDILSERLYVATFITTEIQLIADSYCLKVIHTTQSALRFQQLCNTHNTSSTTITTPLPMEIDL